MLLLLPPSETKRDGGDGAPLDVTTLAHPELAERRAEVVERVVRLAHDPEATMRALKLGPRLASEIERNRCLMSAPTMPAIDRYTGVLFDALGASTLDATSRSFAAETVMVHSALLGLVGALDLIPAYRLSHDSRVPGIQLRRHWREPLAERLAAHRGVIVDLRSEGYADLGPSPARCDSVFVRVVSLDSEGRRRALNHFNKQAKGRFARAFLESRPDIGSIDELIDWAHRAGFTLDLGTRSVLGAPAELELVA
jgi:cytoplasmic iron level regulating protein YaaA (DUF328/UPF0246 family)